MRGDRDRGREGEEGGRKEISPGHDVGRYDFKEGRVRCSNLPTSVTETHQALGNTPEETTHRVSTRYYTLKYRADCS